MIGGFFFGFGLVGGVGVFCFGDRGLVEEWCAEEDEGCVVYHEHGVGMWEFGWAGWSIDFEF